ncbi:pyridoxamine 5'-phosphate oxidase family protein [Nocardia farcinica]|uniref:Pyridoxamine 5'-phosphate oxidase n=1 Tax=Nocardia farcinica (strain IFM 10152) TaxID=247156 RepID=Q5YM43_NOCFA|nr:MULTISPECIES: pyridoxamine 5'-phosphate oxidase family protein [Nocardia]MBF6189151.1 pyridoxamine 5'-phosphate oxidase family protein [Nocardia farcinica]MBF6246347.1 pyridoxamine 5'-phosphate oxidase family protein [Nocardia elegans]MBF6314976.1 pyridoxamine 5'-phosphate oxidase family protein [Nocardia farcinica]MBF6411138.1 pyridoxamine 5'-phosphate oxidase family protein [Nocardia farcinica]MBF6422862.1 pyridoxamine 5'-phosphate oxidase family protein [Nocardia farcinica]
MKKLSTISDTECRVLLRSVPVARIAYLEDGVPAIRPINFTVAGDRIVVWTVPGAHGSAVTGQTVAVQVDRIDPDSHSGWTVLITGPATAISDIDELVAAADIPRRPWVTTPHDQVIGIDIERISGLRLPPAP